MRKAGTSRRGEPFVIHCFDPFSTHPSPSGTAAVRSEPASEPAPGLGECECAELLTPGERRHEARALLVGAEGEDRQGRRARVHGDGHADPGIRARELFEDEDVREEVCARAAVLLRHAHAHEPELRELREQLVREPVLAVPVRRVRRDLRVCELPGERLDGELVGGELEVHLRRTIGIASGVLVEAAARLAPQASGGDVPA